MSFECLDRDQFKALRLRPYAQGSYDKNEVYALAYAPHAWLGAALRPDFASLHRVEVWLLRR